ncbi:RHS repeat domain-containing protein [Capnocytophaga granulosa]|uniref:RHS repeat domain-containing protein n=1 Tax=Capnocytophaga granulosa TaxID=45242 RepID=UPI0023F02486|nr:RHS repeat-associated core domain-containing protein [Capnocytophaga granulosa]
MIFKEHIKDVGYRPVFSGGELRDRGIQPKSTGKGILYTWNANGSLRSVTDLKGVTYRFRYDAFGRRLEKRRMASTFRFVWDGNVLLHETFKKDNSEHTELTTWVFEGFVPTAKLVNGKAYSIISDHLGTPILAIDSEGNEVWNRQLDIYGRVRKEYKHSSLGDEVFPFVPFLYQGQYYDFETGLCYNRFRYYSPETGAYISQDPIGLMGGGNLYSYVHDVNIWVDILGLAEEFEIGTYKSLNGGTNVGDKLDAHELLQSAWLQANHNKTRNSDIGKLNPSIALSDSDIHQNISDLQKRYKMVKANLKGQDAMQNINRNAALTRRGIYEGLKSRGMDDKEAKRKATELTMRLRNDAIEYYQKHIKPLEKSSCNSKK